MAYEDFHELRSGRIAVYKRSGSAKGIYQTRLSLNGVPGYIVRSLGTPLRHEADVKAEELFDELQHQQRTGIDVRRGRLQFRIAWKDFLEKVDLSADRRRLFEMTGRLYFLEFFGDEFLVNMRGPIFEDYFPWRRNIWSQRRESGIIVPPNAADPPSGKTMQMELGMLRQFLNWGMRHNLINQMPIIKLPRLAKSAKHDRRANFTADEFSTLRQKLDDWCSQEGVIIEMPTGGRLHKRGPHSAHRRQRCMIRDLVTLLVRSGLRPGEARKLRWRHVECRNSDTVTLTVPPETKTGTRPVVCIDGANEVLMRIRSYSGHTRPEDLIFCKSDGAPQTDFNQTFQAFLHWAGLLYDQNGKRRCIYSLRHFYATQQLKEKGNMHIFWIAKNMGTSVKFIEQHYAHVQSTDSTELLARNILSVSLPKQHIILDVPCNLAYIISNEWRLPCQTCFHIPVFKTNKRRMIGSRPNFGRLAPFARSAIKLAVAPSSAAKALALASTSARTAVNLSP